MNRVQRDVCKNVAFRIVLGVTLTFLLAGLLLSFSWNAAAAAGSTYNVKDYGAVGNGSHDDAPAIQAAINAAAAGGTVYVPAGTYKVGYNAQGDNASVKLKSNITFQMASGAEIKIATNGAQFYSILSITNVHDITVTGGTLTGDRDTHTGTTGEWGCGLAVWNGTNITIDGVKSRNCWGDGFLVDGNNGTTSQNVTVKNCTADNNRRQGLSICGTVEDNTFSNTLGTMPQGGIDLEPWDAKQTVTEVTVSGNTFKGNGMGVTAGGTAGTVTGITVSGNTISSNVQFGFCIDSCKNFTISDNTITSNGGIGINILGCVGFTAKGNLVIANNGSGIRLSAGYNSSVVSSGCFVQDNKVTGNTSYGVELLSGSTGNTVSGNNIWGNSAQPIFVD